MTVTYLEALTETCRDNSMPAVSWCEQSSDRLLCSFCRRCTEYIWVLPGRPAWSCTDRGWTPCRSHCWSRRRRRVSASVLCRGPRQWTREIREPIWFAPAEYCPTRRRQISDRCNWYTLHHTQTYALLSDQALQINKSKCKYCGSLTKSADRHCCEHTSSSSSSKI